MGRTTLENTNHKLDSTRDRHLLEEEEEDSSSSNIDVGSVVYVTYRSCITAVNQEKLSVLGFQVWFLLNFVLHDILLDFILHIMC